MFCHDHTSMNARMNQAPIASWESACRLDYQGRVAAFIHGLDSITVFKNTSFIDFAQGQRVP